MANLLWRSLSIEGQHLQLPLDWNGCRKETNLAIAGLIFELARNSDGFPVGPKRVAEVRRSGDLHVLGDAERALEDRDTLLDHW